MNNEKVSGIYKWINKVNGKYYVGSGKNLINGHQCRKLKHFNALNKNKHFNEHLQRAWNKYGKENFEFIIIENIPDATGQKLLSTEQKYLDIAKTEKEKCYNMSFIAGKIEMTDEIKAKISKFNKGKHIGNKNHMFGICGNKHPMWGRKHTEESNRKNSESNKIAQKGDKNANYDHTIYTFYNIKTNEEFKGTRYDFYNKYHLMDGNITGMIHGMKGKVSVKNWVIDKQRYLNRHKERNIITKKVYQFNKKTFQLIGIYNSAKQASETTGYSRHMIYKICGKERPSIYGFIWKYENDLTKDDKIKIEKFNQNDQNL